MSKNKTTYLDGRYLLETMQTESVTGRVTEKAKIFCAYLTAREAKLLLEKDKYNMSLYQKLGFRSMFHESFERGQREEIINR